MASDIKVAQVNRVARRSRAKALVMMCALATLMGIILTVSGCGGEGPPAAAGTEKYEAERKAYQDIRRKEYNRTNLEPTKTKGNTTRKKG